MGHDVGDVAVVGFGEAHCSSLLVFKTTTTVERNVSFHIIQIIKNGTIGVSSNNSSIRVFYTNRYLKPAVR